MGMGARDGMMVFHSLEHGDGRVGIGDIFSGISFVELLFVFGDLFFKKLVFVEFLDYHLFFVHKMIAHHF